MAMSNIIGFLEQAGRNAALRHATREQLLRSMHEEKIELTAQQALLQSERTQIDGLLGVRETMYADNQRTKAPKKAPAKKQPAKKAPAKKR
jgi:hypothetical protein